MFLKIVTPSIDFFSRAGERDSKSGNFLLLQSVIVSQKKLSFNHIMTSSINILSGNHHHHHLLDIAIINFIWTMFDVSHYITMRIDYCAKTIMVEDEFDEICMTLFKIFNMIINFDLQLMISWHDEREIALD